MLLYDTIFFLFHPGVSDSMQSDTECNFAEEIKSIPGSDVSLRNFQAANTVGRSFSSCSLWSRAFCGILKTFTFNDVKYFCTYFKLGYEIRATRFPN